jgi:hypothetical protein
VLRKVSAWCEVQEARVTCGWLGFELDLEGLQAGEQARAPAARIVGAGQLAQHLGLRRLPHVGEPAEERGVPQWQLADGLEQAPAPALERAILWQASAWKVGRFRFFHRTSICTTRHAQRIC